MSTRSLPLIMLLVTVASKAPVEQCIDGMSGENCNIPCRASCTTCDRVTEECTGSCRYQQYFGKLCNQTCPVLCDGPCDKKTGACISCKPTYGGARCNNPCPTNCRTSCDMKTMECHLCKPGFTGKFCDEICTQLNSTCIEPCPDEGTYGDDCEEPCPENCRDGCYRDTGECLNCAVGFGGLSCNESCPDNCLNGCDRYQGTCNDCKVGYSGERCPDNCPANCYDKCDQKTGHCFGCVIGFQGEKCNENCPEKCNGGCYQTTGVCKSCGTGLMGQFCNDSCKENCKDACDQRTGKCMKCEVGFTGVFCDQTCSRYCRDECEQTSGECIGCIDGFTGRFCNFVIGKKLLKGVCGALGAALMVLGLTLIIVVKRRRHTTLQNGQARLDAIPEANDDRESTLTGHKYYEIVDDNLINNREMVTARGNNLPHQNVNLPPPLPSQQTSQRTPASKQDVNLRLPPPLPSQRIPQGSCPSQQDVNLRLPPPLQTQRKPPLITLTQLNVDPWSPCPSPCQQVQAKTSRPQTSGPFSTCEFYLDAIFESSINSASTFSGHRYDDINKENLVKDSRRMVTARSDGSLPVLLQSPRSPLPEQDIDIQLRPSFVGQQDLPAIPQDICLSLPLPLPRQRQPPDHPPLQQDVDLEFHTSLPCQQDQVKSPRPKRVNYHFDCDVILENVIYESVDEVLFPNKEIVLPTAESKEEQIVPEEELEHLKHPVAVGGAPALAYSDVEATDVPAIVTDADDDDDDDNIVKEIIETSV